MRSRCNDNESPSRGRESNAPNTKGMITPHWSPELVKAQQKAALMTKFCRAAMIRKTPLRILQWFADQARSIDTSWTLPERLPELLVENKKLFKQQAITAKKNARKLRDDYLKRNLDRGCGTVDVQNSISLSS